MSAGEDTRETVRPAPSYPQTVSISSLELTYKSSSSLLSLVKIRGYANPETAQLRTGEDTDISTIEDIGPSVVHFYEISNTGPFDVGNVFVRRKYFSSKKKMLTSLSSPLFSWKSVGHCRPLQETGCSTSQRRPSFSTQQVGPGWRRRNV